MFHSPATTRLILSLGFAACAASASANTDALLPAQPTAPPAARQAPNTLSGTDDYRSLPAQLTGAYLFIAGKVGEHSGVFMFDTGTPLPFMLNNAAIPLKLDQFQGVGKAGSAQGSAGRELKVYRHDHVGPIELADTSLGVMDALLSSDFSFMTNMSRNGLRTDILGFAGLPLFREYEFVVDYAIPAIALYRMKENGDTVIPHVDPGKIVATLAYRQVAGEPAHLPYVTLTLGGIEIEALLDTGVPGELALTPQARRALERSGHLQKTDTGWMIKGLMIQGTPLIADTPEIRAAQKNTMRLGFNFLRHYRSVWNVRKRTVTLLLP